jgi:hypothetical protein
LSNLPGHILGFWRAGCNLKRRLAEGNPQGVEQDGRQLRSVALLASIANSTTIVQGG